MKKNFVYSALASAVVFAMSSAYAEEQKTEELDEITVTGGSMFRMGEVPFDQAKSTVAVSSETLDREGVTKADELGRYQAGFTNQSFGNDTNTNWFRVRGAEATQAVDGMPSLAYGFFTPHTNVFGLEAVEITKGADALTFGAAHSGGLINYVSKRPHKEQVGKGEFKTQLGNHNQYGVGIDYTGAFNADETARYRFVANYFATDGEIDQTDNKTYYIAPSFEFDLTPKTRLTILTSFQRDHGTPSSNFFPQDGTLVPTANGKIDRKTNLGDPVNDTETNRQYSLGYELEHDFDNGFRVNSSYHYAYVDNYHRGSYAYPAAYSATYTPISFADAGSYSLTRGVVFNDGTARSHTLDNHLSYDFKNESIKNTVVAGFDYRHQRVNALYTLFGATSATNVFNSHSGYNQAQDVSSAPNTHIKSRQLGFYLQDSLTIKDTVKLGMGIRHDKARNDEYSSSQSVKANKTSYSASAMYLSPIGLNPYYSYTESFRLPTGLSGNQSLYKPNTTKQHEVGVKYLPNWLDGTISIAYFQAKDKGALISNGTTATVSSVDPIKRRGVEVQLDAQLTKNISAIFAYTYLKAERETATENIRQELFPKHSFSAATNYAFTEGTLEGLTLGAGVRYMGSSVTASQYGVYNGARVPSATVVDLMANYAINKNWSAQVNVQNVGDRKFLSGCDTYCYYGASRNILATVSYKW